MKGVFHEVKGSVREIAGKVTSNSFLKTKGRIERIAGGFQRKIGKAQGLAGF
jgi:uncharacterized protein YjbJ (UPF0337 family)